MTQDQNSYNSGERIKYGTHHSPSHCYTRGVCLNELTNDRKGSDLAGSFPGETLSGVRRFMTAFQVVRPSRPWLSDLL